MKKISAPEGGWEESTWYLVEVAYSRYNIIHRALFFSGFLHEGEPTGYNQFVSAGYENELLTYDQACYLKVIRKVVNASELIIKSELLGDRI